MPVKEWIPTARQSDFISLPDEIFEALYGGAAGGGKSETLLMLPVVKKDKRDRPLYEHHKFKMLFLRRTFPELDSEIIPRSKEFYPHFGFLPYQDQKRRWTHQSGSIIQFGHCEHEGDVKKYDTSEYNIIAFDESTSFTPFQYEYLTFSRCRTSSLDLPAIVRSGTNPGNIGHCVAQGDVLTPTGWRDISSLKLGDAVYEVDPQTLALVESTVEQFHVHQYDGKLWNIESSNLSVECTPEHSILRQKKPQNTYTLTNAEDLPGQAYIARTIENTNYSWPDKFTVSGEDLGRFEQPREIPYEYYAELMGWFISEGYTLSEKAQEGQSGRFFAISQSKEDNRIRVHALLQSCGFKYSFDKDQFRVYSPAWHDYFAQFDQCRDKFIPRELLNCDQQVQACLFDSLMKGDGYTRNNNSGIYYTTSKQLSNDFAELAFKLGYRVKITFRQRENRAGLTYEIAYDSNKVTEVLTGQHKYNVATEVKRPKNVFYTNFSGTVYDIGVPLFHTFVIKQNGSVWISGNSYFRTRFVQPARQGNILLNETRTVLGKAQTLLRIYIPSKATDNTYLMAADPDYVNRLNRLPAAERAAKADGDWWTFSGQVFEDWRTEPFPDEPRNAQHVCEPFQIPSYWPKVLSIDWGYAALTIGGWYAINPCPSVKYPAKIYKYREYTCKKTKISTWAADMRRLSGEETYTDLVMDPSGWQERGDPVNIAEQFAKVFGRQPRKAQNNRVGGKLLLQELLRWRPRPARYVPQSGFNDELASKIRRMQGPAAYEEYCKLFLPEEEERFLPQFQVFSTCAKTIETIPLCVYDKDRPEDVAEFDGDDPYDETRYGVSACQNYLDGGLLEANHETEVASVCSTYEQTGNINQFYMMMNSLDAKRGKESQGIRRFHSGRNRNRMYANY
jgi:hypothetical protein